MSRITSETVRQGMVLTDQWNQDCRVEAIQRRHGTWQVQTRRFDQDGWWDTCATWTPDQFNARQWFRSGARLPEQRKGRPLGHNQVGVLKALAEHGPWQDCWSGWTWSTPVVTTKIMESLVGRGLVAAEPAESRHGRGKTRYRLTKAGEDCVGRLLRGLDGRAAVEIAIQDRITREERRIQDKIETARSLVARAAKWDQVSVRLQDLAEAVKALEAAETIMGVLDADQD